ncbi:MAG: DUF533 domain-containing protein [Pseudomonadota bacterium]
MSFMRTLATVAVGFAAAKGVDSYRKMGGMAGMQDMFKSGGKGAGMADQLGQMAEKMGIPGGAKAVQDMMANFSGQASAGAAGAGAAGAAGLGGLMNAIQGSMGAGAKTMDDMFSAMTKGTPVSDMMENNAKLMIRAMIQAAKSDGEIDEDEKKMILEHLADASPEEMEFVKEQLAAPVDYAALAQDTADHMKAQVYSTSLMAIKVDSDAEVAYLKGLATALGLSPEAQNQIHAQMGVAPASA